jgi:hypothetical protein
MPQVLRRRSSVVANPSSTAEVSGGSSSGSRTATLRNVMPGRGVNRKVLGGALSVSFAAAILVATEAPALAYYGPDCSRSTIVCLMRDGSSHTQTRMLAESGNDPNYATSYYYTNTGASTSTTINDSVTYVLNQDCTYGVTFYWDSSYRNWLGYLTSCTGNIWQYDWSGKSQNDKASSHQWD